MLKPDFAAESLQKLYIKNGPERCLERISCLPPILQEIGYVLLGRNEDGSERKSVAGNQNYEEIQRANLQAIANLESRTPQERVTLFEALYPKLAVHVEAAWRIAPRLSYQSSYTRKAFRAPSSPATLRYKRLEALQSLLPLSQYYAQDIVWLAAWAPYLGYHASSLGLLFAAAIDGGGEEGEQVFEILLASARGEHEIGAMGRHVSRGLLTASRPEGWEFIEKYLLAAQRQEGLRQVVLETIDEAHPEAFRRMLRLIIEHDLTRFSATIRAVDVWFGFQWDVTTIKQVDKVVAQILRYIEEPAEREAALQNETGQTLYLALCASGYEDAITAIEPAVRLLTHPEVERRFVAVHFLGELGLTTTAPALQTALEDSDLRVVWRAFSYLQYSGYRDSRIGREDGDLFECLERLIPRLPAKEKELELLVWPWMTQKLNPQQICNRLNSCLGDRSPKRLLPYLSRMDGYGRGGAAQALINQTTWDEETRKAIFALAGDAQEGVRKRAYAALEKRPIQPEEVLPLEKLLQRKTTDLRSGVLTLLLQQPDTETLNSAARLLAARDSLQRMAGLEMLQQMIKQERSVTLCREQAARYRDSQQQVSESEARLLHALLDTERKQATLNDALGLMDLAKRKPPVSPQMPARKIAFTSQATVDCLRALNQRIVAQRETPVQHQQWDGVKEVLFGNISYGFPMPNYETPLEQDLPRLLLRDEWENWWSERPDTLRDSDGFELLRLYNGVIVCRVYYYYQLPSWARRLKQLFSVTAEDAAWKLLNPVEMVVPWLMRMHPPAGAADFVLDAAEATLNILSRFATRPSTPGNQENAEEDEEDFDEDADDADMDPELLEMLGEVGTGFLPQGADQEEEETPSESADSVPAFFDIEEALEPIFTAPLDEKEREKESTITANFDWRSYAALSSWMTLANLIRQSAPALWGDAQQRRWWRLLRWKEQPYPEATPCRPTWNEVLDAYRIGEANEQDLLHHLLGPRDTTRYYTVFDVLKKLTARKPPSEFAEFPELKALVERCRERILEVELHRGDLPTAATSPATALRTSGGLDTLVRVLTTLGDAPFTRSEHGIPSSRTEVFSHLIRTTFPAEADTPEQFAATMAQTKVTRKRLIELAVFAPQWAKHVEFTLGRPALEEAVWWLHAHTKDSGWSTYKDIREEWAAATAERTPLTAEDLEEGAVDVAWFQRVYSALGPDWWKQLDEAAKFATGGSGHKRAQLFADAMLGRLTKETLTTRITQKRDKDAARALGLLPLAEGESGKQDALDRYQILQEFLRGSRKFGSQRQASEKTATRIGLENLARTAGFVDPARLEWAMEAEAVADLANGPISVTVTETTVTLSINPLGRPEINITKAGKLLKAIPPAVKKDPTVTELTERKTEIERQASRMRLSLEAAMCRGDRFSATDLQELLLHPVLAPMLRSLVFIGEGVAGYPIEGGRKLENYDGVACLLEPHTSLLIAHPHDLLGTNAWPQWQRDCFLRERIQPFKQVFRELYVLTEGEQEGNLSNRYSGHQVNPKQAVALLGSRGWVVSPEEGVRRTFHQERISAWATFDQGFTTPAEVEGLTVEQVGFSKAGEWKPIPLAEVPARLFSEAMRDMDLVVSVAHMGGIDPEASASTTQMREVLIRETCTLLKLTNVRFQGNHALIDGHLGTYSIHLGSAVVHRQPGGHLCIVPIHGQHRGRLFLPFADDDPRTAEIVSKVLLLAKDTEIKDPTILEQILPRG